MGHVAWGIVIACGKDEQITAETDAGFLSIGGQPALAHVMTACERCPEIEGVVVVARKERLEGVVGIVRMFGITKTRKVVAGGLNRKASLQSALKALDEDVSILCIHEASRPCVTAELIGETVKSAKRHGSGVAAVRLTESVKEVQRGQTVSASLDPGKLWVVQKPQSYRRELLAQAIEAASKEKTSPEDESDMMALIQQPVRLVPGSVTNIRIRSVGDLSLATALLSQVASAT